MITLPPFLSFFLGWDAQLQPGLSQRVAVRFMAL